MRARMTCALSFAIVLVACTGAALASGGHPDRGKVPAPAGPVQQGQATEQLMTEEGWMGANLMQACPSCKMMLDSPSPAAWMLQHQNDLNLSDDQVKKLRDQDMTFRRKQADRMAELQKDKTTLQGVLAKTPVDTGDLKDAMEDVSDDNIEMATAWVEAQQDAMDELTPQQRSTIIAMGERYQKEHPQQRPGAMGKQQPEQGAMGKQGQPQQQPQQGQGGQQGQRGTEQQRQPSGQQQGQGGAMDEQK